MNYIENLAAMVAESPLEGDDPEESYAIERYVGERLIALSDVTFESHMDDPDGHRVKVSRNRWADFEAAFARLTPTPGGIERVAAIRRLYPPR